MEPTTATHDMTEEPRDSPDGDDVTDDIHDDVTTVRETPDDVTGRETPGKFEKRNSSSKKSKKKKPQPETVDSNAENEDIDSDRKSDSIASSKSFKRTDSIHSTKSILSTKSSKRSDSILSSKSSRSSKSSKSGHYDVMDDDITNKTDVPNDVTDSLPMHDVIELGNDNLAYSDSEDEFETRRNSTKTKAIVSFVIDDVGQPQQKEKEKKKQMAREGRRKRDLFFALTSDLSIMYGSILTLMGFAFPLTEALRNEWMTTNTVGIFNVYIYVVSTVFLIYISVYMWLSNRKLHKKERGNSLTGDAMQTQGGVVMLRMVNPPSEKNSQEENMRHAYMRSITDVRLDSGNEKPFATYDELNYAKPPSDLVEYKRERKQSEHSMVSDNMSESNFSVRKRKISQTETPIDAKSNPITDEIFDEVMVLHSTASLGHDGASFYLRIGALLFGMANFIYVVVQIDEHFRQVDSGCYDLPEVYPMFFHLIFLVVQTFYIFKNTKIHLKNHKYLARFGFAHVLATNMCNWFRILVFEVMEGIYKTEKSIDKGDGNKTYTKKYPNETSCLHIEGIYYAMAPYLFPFVLEYSLVAAATMAGMYQSLNVRVTQDILQAVKKAIWQRRHGQENRHNHEHEDIFAKSHKGMFGGVCFLAAAVVAIIMFHFALSFDKDEKKALMVYYWSDIVLHGLLIPPVIYCGISLSKFKFTYNRENTIDDFLLLLSMGGLILYNVFIAFTSVSGELYFEEGSYGAIGTQAKYLNLAGAILNIIQCILQGVFVIAGLQLCACSTEQSKEKPGRGAIALLILGNLALWFFKTFLIKEVSLHSFVDFFGPTAWPIIMNTSLPLVLFYRFHVSVCLADMWSLVYKPETGPKYKMLQ